MNAGERSILAHNTSTNTNATTISRRESAAREGCVPSGTLPSSAKDIRSGQVAAIWFWKGIAFTVISMLKFGLVAMQVRLLLVSSSASSVVLGGLDALVLFHNSSLCV